MRRRLQSNVKVEDIVKQKSTEKFFENILSKEIYLDRLSCLQTEQGTLVGAVPLLPKQEWFLRCNFGAAHHWNQSFLIKTPRLDLSILQDSLEKLVQHHDSFRLRYKKDEKSNTYNQYYDGYAKVESVKVLDISSLGYGENSQAFKNKLKDILICWQNNFDLKDGPTYSVGYIHGYHDGSARTYFALHALIVDAVSCNILSKDLKYLYYGNRLDCKRSSYCQWTNAVKDYPKKHQKEQQYWNNILSDYNSSQLTKISVRKSTARYTSIELSQEYTTLLMEESNQAYNTQSNDLLLTALGYSLKESTGCNINHIVLKDHGREELDSAIDITRTLGCFTTMYPVRIEIGDSLRASIKFIKEHLRAMPNKGLGYGAILGYVPNDLPKISFTYFGQFGRENSGKLSDTNFWHMTEENSGISMNPNNWDTNVININCLVVDNRLRFNIVSKLDVETTKNLARVFKERLKIVINHTVNQPRSYLTVSDIRYIISKDRLDAIQEQHEIEAIFLANSLQQGFIYSALSQEDIDDAHVVQFIWQYHQPMNINHLEQAWEYAIAKFSCLRLRFDWQEDLVQIINKEGCVDWRFVDISNELISEKQENIIKDIQEKDRLERYDLAKGNLLRIYVIKQKWDLYSCILSYHHAIIDGWSMPFLLECIHDTYLRLDRKEVIILQPDYAYEMTQLYIQEHREDHKSYWDTYIAQVEERSDISCLLISNEKRLCEYRHTLYPNDKTVAITGQLYRGLKLLSQQEGVTVNAILQFVWHKVLSIYGNSKQTIVGTTLSGRSLPINDIEKSVGLYINTLPLIVNHQRRKRVIESIRDIQSDINELNRRNNISLAKLQPSSERLFDSIFIYQNHINRDNLAKGVKLKFKGSVEKFDYPLIVRVYEGNTELMFNLQYARELFGEDTINHVLQLTRTLLEQLPNCANLAVTNLNYLNTQQYDQIIHNWNATGKEYPATKTIHELFEEQAAKTPNGIALVYEELQLSYKELNERANQLAIFLMTEFNIKSDRLIPLCLDRSEHMIIAILAVLKSGGAYVPVDPDYPDDRIQHILQDAGATLLLSIEKYRKKLERFRPLSNTNQEYLEVRKSLSVLSIDSREFQDVLKLQAVTNPNSTTKISHLACVSYTSGTTGEAKGVMVEHRGLVNLNYGLIQRFGFDDLNKKEVILQFTNYAFIASLQQMFLGLLNGHVLLLIPNQLWLDKEAFINYLYVNKVTHIHAPPRFLDQYCFSKISSLKRVICGGELLHKQSYDKISLYNQLKIINIYGLTETSGCSTISNVREDSLNKGSPISNVRCYVLDDNLLPLPIGAIGDLYIGGEGLARGYLNRPDLTSMRFIANRFQTEAERNSVKNSRLYKTGDLVRWLPGGNLEFIGRNDFQVKIRGYRIELGEIESALLGYKGIKQTVALAKEHSRHIPSESLGFKYLVGYYVSDTKLDEESILLYLESKLPEYMVPAMLVHIDTLPLTVNGKLDRKALPDPEFTRLDNHEAPRNQIEEKSCQIWAEVLGLNAEKIGIHDDFFRLGGDSIISIQLVNRLRKTLKLNVSVQDVFRYKSIAGLYENILSKQLSVDRLSSLQTEQGILVGAVPLLPIQQWFFWKNVSAANQWNQSILIKTPRLDLGKLQDSLEILVQHHDSFRLRYRKDERRNTYKQYYDRYAEVARVKLSDVKTLEYPENSEAFKFHLQELLTHWQANFDLSDGPLYTVGYIYGYKDTSARIYFALHRLIVDTVSWCILMQDLRDLYYGKSLGSKGSSYRQWAKAIKDYASKHQDEQTYWENILSNCDSSGLNKFVESESTAQHFCVSLSEEHTALLLKGSNQAYNTQISDLLLTALGYSLEEITGCNINHIMLESHGREKIESSIDITRTLGWFTTIFPVRLEINNTLGTSIKAIKEYLRAIPDRGLGYGTLLGFESNALPRINFKYLSEYVQGNRQELNDMDIWQISPEDSGISMNPKNRDTNMVLSINGLIGEGRLRFNVVSALDEKTTDKLARVLKEHLLAIINHCKNKNTMEYTMSDFKDFEPYVLFNKEVVGSNKLFMFPPRIGGAESYFKNIVPYLHNKSLIIFNNFFVHLSSVLGNNYAMNLTFEKLAENFITHIKLIQPEGPYNLFGWSFGGVLAFEISRQLTKRGDFVANLTLMDSYFKYKSVALTTNSEFWLLNTINSKYPVSPDIEMPDTNIILYKSTKVEEINFYENFFKGLYSKQRLIEKRNIDTFYTKNTKSNNLDKLLCNHKIRVVPMNSSHYMWVNNDDVVKEVCFTLGKI